ncbi:MerR family transcriptional regulator [Novosphingobium huizhouense]|uniref:MerR family transcriptional regulator n=1 Tax=Novosphingobium huizhouense TaxID=2866625 RepID=UPI001CD86F19|nr:MerR family transcriptional regulator [Novosphingobium huizhouense]
MKQTTIAGLARAGGVGVETVRYYQRRGLLAEPARSEHGGYRTYDAADARRLRFIRQAQSAGFTLEQIRELLDLDSVEDRDRARALALSRIAELDVRIAEMESARDALRRLAADCGSGGDGPCPILSAFEVDPVALD